MDETEQSAADESARMAKGGTLKTAAGRACDREQPRPAALGKGAGVATGLNRCQTDPELRLLRARKSAC